ncbi:hypothetical protein F8M41_007702 [Gigaspora margarita]|uniref:Uncharacterized protein n=1 Tax=Gigaspora margarita TaxID=4874 RepID=A0A8H4A2V9_GIGMA|nr:hypothetical protein F8M41_007702 [Gigaspora margarita]
MEKNNPFLRLCKHQYINVDKAEANDISQNLLHNSPAVITRNIFPSSTNIIFKGANVYHSNENNKDQHHQPCQNNIQENDSKTISREIIVKKTSKIMITKTTSREIVARITFREIIARITLRKIIAKMTLREIIVKMTFRRIIAKTIHRRVIVIIAFFLFTQIRKTLKYLVV